MPVPARRRPSGVRVIESAFGEAVPPVIEKMIRLRLYQAENADDENVIGAQLNKLKKDLAVVHLPTADYFQPLFLRRRAYPPEVKVDEETNRVYLAAIAKSDRTEYALEEIDVHPNDPVADDPEIQKELVTIDEVRQDSQIIFTELSWSEFRGAYRTAQNMPGVVRESLVEYFDLSPHKLVEVLLATPGFDDEDRRRITMSVQQRNRLASNRPTGPQSLPEFLQERA